jgi:hypothetical protein
MRISSDFYSEILKVYDNPSRFYGEDDLAVGSIFSGVKSREEAEQFRDAISDFLKSCDSDKRIWAVRICTGFIYFHGAIEAPSYYEPILDGIRKKFERRRLIPLIKEMLKGTNWNIDK